MESVLAHLLYIFGRESCLNFPYASEDFSLLHWPAGTVATARDLWAQQDFPASQDHFPSKGVLDVEPHSTLLCSAQKVLKSRGTAVQEQM